MDASWIVAANSGRARFFAEATAADSLEEIEDMVNDAARLTTAESETDRIGPRAAGKSIHKTGGALPHKTYEPAQTPDQHAAEIFAKDVAQYLLSGYHDGRFREIALVASPQFLGVLRKQLDPQLAQLVRVEINKDYTGLSPDQLREQVRAKKLEG